MISIEVVIVSALVLALPGLLVGWMCGLRGWVHLALAPLLSIAMAGVSGPLLHLMGVPFAWWSYALAVLVFSLLARLVSGRLRSADGPRFGFDRGDLVVAAGVAVGAVIGILPVALAMHGTVVALPQSWDSPVHANLIAYIARTGVGDWSAVSYLTAGAPQSFYPVGLHSLEAIVVQMMGIPSTWAYNTFILLTPLQLSIAAAAAGRVLAPRTKVAATVAAVAAVIPTFSLYYLLLTQPYAWTVACCAAVLALFLSGTADRTRGWTVALCLSMAGLIALQPSAVAGFGVLVIAWLLLGAVPIREKVSAVVMLAVAGIAAVVLCIPELRVGLRAVAGVAAFNNKLHLPLNQVLAAPIGYGGAHSPQVLVGLAVLVSIVIVLVAGRTSRWLVLAYFAFVGLYLVAHLWQTRIGRMLTGLWYNDPARLVMLFAVTGSLIVAMAVTILSERIATMRSPVAAQRLRVVGAVGLAALTVASAVLYIPRNRGPVQRAYGNGPSLTFAQRDVLERLPQWVGPGQRVLNDPWQGSVWMYVYSGVMPIQGHYGDGSTPQADLVLRHYDELDTNPKVAKAIVDMRVCAVYVGTGSVIPKGWIWSGMDKLDATPSLRLAYSDPQSKVYLLQGPLARQAHCGAGQQSSAG